MSGAKNENENFQAYDCCKQDDFYIFKYLSDFSSKIGGTFITLTCLKHYNEGNECFKARIVYDRDEMYNC